MTLNQEMVAEITREVVARLQAQMTSAPAGPAIRDGVFPTVDAAVQGAAMAQLKVGQMSLADRGKAVAIIKRMCEQNADDNGELIDGDESAANLRGRDFRDIHRRQAGGQTNGHAAENPPRDEEIKIRGERIAERGHGKNQRGGDQ